MRSDHARPARASQVVSPVQERRYLCLRWSFTGFGLAALALVLVLSWGRGDPPQR
jgi:hypothetical protein